MSILAAILSTSIASKIVSAALRFMSCRQMLLLALIGLVMMNAPGLW